MYNLYRDQKQFVVVYLEKGRSASQYFLLCVDWVFALHWPQSHSYSLNTYGITFGGDEPMSV